MGLNGAYKSFLKEKELVFRYGGFEVDDDDISNVLFPFQRDLVRWAIRKGRSGIFADTGLGKTLMQAEWAKLMRNELSEPVIIVAPLSVARQTVGIAKEMLDIDINYERNGGVHPITITNYEMVEKFNPADFGAIVLDESSILKGIGGKTKQLLTDMFVDTDYKLCCTATPSPNDIVEIANHAEFLGIMTRNNMLSAFFVHDQDGYRLRAHGVEKFYRWLASWGMSVRKPSDLGYSDDGYDLPPLNIEPIFVDSNYKPDDQLFFTGLSGIGDRTKVRAATIDAKCKAVAAMVNSSDEQWIIWTGLNDESKKITSMIPDATEVEGSDSIDSKIASIEGFQNGDHRVLVTKPKIAGMGMNFQNSHNMAFIGMSDSWEEYYQSIRRQYRFGQTEPVNVYLVLADIEQEIYHNVKRKEEQAKTMADELIKNVQQYEVEEMSGINTGNWEYQTDDFREGDAHLMLGDSTERLKELEDDSVDLSVFSPPFQSLYTYSPTERDLGNSKNEADFYQHFTFIVDELLRVTKPGRICAVHVADVPAMQVRDGYIGLKDFSGDVIRLFIEHGWIFDARVPIDKNQQAQSIRTHTKALTMTQLEKDRTWNRPALPDYILKFRKPGENAVPVIDGDITRNLWIEWANPTWPNEDRTQEMGAYATWYGIRESDTLQGWRQGKWHRQNGGKDERHICPLQLGTIERCIRLWSNKGETVLTPFLGIGSEAHEAIRLGRKAIGIELKPEYFREAIKNIKKIQTSKIDLFSFAGLDVRS